MTAPAAPASLARHRGRAVRVARRPRTRRNAELALLALAMVLVAAYAAHGRGEPARHGHPRLLGAGRGARRGLPRPAPGRSGSSPRTPTRCCCRRWPCSTGSGWASCAGSTWPRRRRPSGPTCADLRRHGGRQLAWTLAAVILAAGAARDHPRPPGDLPVRVHAGPGRHRAGDDPGGAAGAASPRSTAPSCGSGSAASPSSPVSSPSWRCWSFFAYYLVRKREVLSLASRRFLGIDFPRGRDLGPVRRRVAAQPPGAGLREGPRHLAALLRHVRGDALHRHRAGQLADHRSAALLRRRLPRLPARRDGRRPVRQLLRPGARSGSTRSPTRTTRATSSSSRCSAWAPAGSSAPGRAAASRPRCPRCTTTSSSPAWARRSASSASPRCSSSTC